MLRQGRALLADGEMLFGGARDLLCGGERADAGQQPFAEKLDLRRVGPFRRANEVVAEIAVQYGVEGLDQSAGGEIVFDVGSLTDSDAKVGAGTFVNDAEILEIRLSCSACAMPAAASHSVQSFGRRLWCSNVDSVIRVAGEVASR